MCGSYQRRGALLIGGLVLLLAWSAGAPDPVVASSCTKTCKRDKKKCIKAFKRRFKVQKRACVGEVKKECKRAAKRQRAEGRAACNTMFRETCKPCCVAAGTACAVAVCGNGDATGEPCDDGNVTDGDGCDSNCTLTACGNGIITAGEECDDGAENSDVNPGSCRTDCTRARCGNDVMESLEVCDGTDAAACGGQPCRANCTCLPAGCGDGVLSGGEECEIDAHCAIEGNCVDCTCVPALGVRTISVEGGELYSSVWGMGETVFGHVTGTIVLHGGVPDRAGASEVSTRDGPFYFLIETSSPDAATARICLRVTSCTGVIYCNGGANVDVLVERDSAGCDGGSGNASVATTGVGGTDSGAGAMSLACLVATAATAMECSAATYSGPDVELALTTGTNTAVMLDECINNALGPATIQKVGENFACDDWTAENGPGALVFTQLSEEPSSIVVGDTAQAGILGD